MPEGKGRNIILVGFMGTGKSTVGRMIAARLGHEFVDTDELIEQGEGVPISRIFAEKGEGYFRQREAEVIDQVCREDERVIVTGGGAVVDAVNAARLKESGTVVCLTARPEVILERVRDNDDRPLLQGGDPLDKIRTLLTTRAEAYAKADVTIDTSVLGEDEVVEAVLVAVGTRGK